jgi:hypothetical protein
MIVMFIIGVYFGMCLVLCRSLNDLSRKIKSDTSSIKDMVKKKDLKTGGIIHQSPDDIKKINDKEWEDEVYDQGDK